MTELTIDLPGTANTIKYLKKRQHTPSLIAKKTELKPIFSANRQAVAFNGSKRFKVYEMMPKKQTLPAIEGAATRSEMMGYTKNTLN